MIQYLDWAKGQLRRIPSVDDWQNMRLAEMAERALAICEVAKDGTVDGPQSAFYHLEKMAKAIKEKYPHPKPRGW